MGDTGLLPKHRTDQAPCQQFVLEGDAMSVTLSTFMRPIIEVAPSPYLMTSYQCMTPNRHEHNSSVDEHNCLLPVVCRLLSAAVAAVVLLLPFGCAFVPKSTK